MYEIITFGSATKDIFLTAREFQLVKNKKFITGKGVCFNLGSKIDIKEIAFSSGGGGTNSAATFGNQGFKVAYCGSVGNDLAGQEIIEQLNNLGVDTKFINKSSEKPTNHSIVLNGVGDERTILVYRGASEALKKENIPFDNLQTNWIYIAPLSGELCKVFEDIIDFAVKNKIRIALNPGSCQLALPEKVLKRAISKVDILLLNQEEASILTKIPFSKEKEIFKKLDQICPGIVIMTKGEKGATLSDGRHLYRVNGVKTKIIDKTGAGDALGSGFVAGFIQTGGDVEAAIQLGMGNAVSCLKHIGAKAGLLKKGDNFAKVKIKKEACAQSGLCKCKVC